MNRPITILCCLIASTSVGQIYTPEINVVSSTNGKVGIGTNSPIGLLHLVPGSFEAIVLGNGQPESTARINSITFTNINAGSGDNGIRWLDGNGNLSGYAFGSVTGDFYLGSVNGEINFLTAGQSRFWVDNTGKVGIGTENPSELFHIHGSSPVLRISNSDSGSGESSIDLTRSFDGTSGTRSNWIYFGRNNSSSYKWRVGATKTSAWFNSSDYRIDHLFSSQWENYLFVQGSGTNRGFIGINTTNPSYRLDVNGTLRATSVTESSDRRLKENISPLTTSNLQLITGFQYNLKSDGSFHYGVIAQEVEKIFPHMVSTDDQGMKSVAYNEFIPLLIEKVKEQDEEMSNQQSEINKLKKEILELKQLLLTSHKNEN